MAEAQRISENMNSKLMVPDFLFETSWEVCNKVGGIYTVLSTHAKTLKAHFHDNLVFIGPDLRNPRANIDFREDPELWPSWKEAASKVGMKCRIGRWAVPSEPVAVLVDFSDFFERKNAIYGKAWELFGVDSLSAYGDYDEASMFSYAAGEFVRIVKEVFLGSAKVVYHAHEWMSGLGMLFLKHNYPDIATVFTTHATSIGRSIAGNNKALYAYFEGYDGDQMARELHMEAKHSVEKQSALHADCFTTVSNFTARECTQLLGKTPDVVLPNGFEGEFVPSGARFTSVRQRARKKILAVASALTGSAMSEQTLIVSTSGRNDFRCKGFDVFLDSMALLLGELNACGEACSQVLALIEVPCWLKAPRADLLARLHSAGSSRNDSHEEQVPLSNPFITHELHNFNDDRIVQQIHRLGLLNRPCDKVKVMLVPSYLDGSDGIFDLPYYEILSTNDLAIYPSYYEPWGYTPLEALAFHAPCVTTDLSGFGQWALEAGSGGGLESGVRVIHRDDSNYFEVVREIGAAIKQMLQSDAKARRTMRAHATSLAEKARWEHFIRHYLEAYDFALRSV